MSRQPKYPTSRYENLMMPSDDMDTILECYRSKLVKTRKETNCSYCGIKIEKGDYALTESCFMDGKAYRIHDCLDCAESTINDWKDEDYERWKQRTEESGYFNHGKQNEN